MKNILITTTNSIENSTIERYIDIISTNVVIGTNVFSDFAASFTDFFGGTSETYQKKLDIIYKSAIDTLSQKAKALGANCILGLHVDFDEIAGKGKSMFMISAIGTAVKISLNINVTKEQYTTSNFIISSEILASEARKIGIIQKIESGDLPSSEEWEFLFNQPVTEIAELLLDKLITIVNTSLQCSEKESLLLKNYSHYLGKIDRDKALSLLKEKIDQAPKTIIQLICNNNLFDPHLVIDKINNDKLNLAIRLLKASKDFYTNDDLLAMKEIISLMDNLPDKGSIEIVKGVFSKGEEKYICPNGHKNPRGEKFCTEYLCQMNIKGLTPDQINELEIFKNKIKALEDLLSKNKK